MNPRDKGAHREYLNAFDWHHYEFVRRSGLSRGYFDKGPTADFWVVVVCVVCLIVGLAVSL